eukprot:g2157.t1
MDGSLGSGNSESALWYKNAPEEIDSKRGLPYNEGKELQEKAERLWEAEAEAFERGNSSSSSAVATSASDTKFLRTMMKSGTLADRLSAMALMVTTSPLHHWNTLNALVNAAAKKTGSREALLAVEAAKDLFINNLLPPNRPLRRFHDWPLGAQGITDKHLVFWIFESKLKDAYGVFVQALEDGMAVSSLMYCKRACLHAAFDLLSSVPEGERRMLHILVGKLKDSERRIVGESLSRILQFVESNPGVRGRVISELIAQARGSEGRTQYNNLICLNQVPLDRTESGQRYARRMVRLYVKIFESYHDTKEQEAKEEGGSGVAEREGNDKKSGKLEKKRGKQGKDRGGLNTKI